MLSPRTAIVTIQGKFSTMSMADLIQWGRTAQRTGLLRVIDEKGKQIEVTFRDGRIIWSSTSELRHSYSSYLLFLGYCTGAEIAEALRASESAGVMLASALVHNRTLTREVAVSTLTEKTVEDLCDVFLWREGSFQFDPVLPNTKDSIVINLDPIRVVSEGVRRADVWSRITAAIHPTSFFEQGEEPFPSEGAWENAKVARHVFDLLDGSSNVHDIVLKLPFSRYQVYRAISEMLQRRVIVPGDVTSTVDRQQRIIRKIDEACRAANEARWTEALEMLQGLASAYPGRQEILHHLLRITDEFRQAIYEHNFILDDVPVVTIGPDAISHVNLDSSDAFVFSRIDGHLTVRRILKISPLTEAEGLRVFKRLLNAKVIDFPNRRELAPKYSGIRVAPLVEPVS
ncbi:MAG TPA: DUF4388 domain-containing protein [Thermoanaerobaculia bacterium]|nr:DUF4388 domain-containing protein [Thermoanaerobaculia bacterium]